MSKLNIKERISKIRNLDDNFFTPYLASNIPHDPSLLLNIEKAFDKFNSYLNSNSNILILADPDIDGIMASSIMYQWIKPIHDNVKIIHHQRNKGHGVREENIEKTDLLIIVDSSSNEVDEIKKIYDNDKAQDVIIIDHHEVECSHPYIIGNGTIYETSEPKIKLNTKAILINPHQPLDIYPNKNVSGALLTLKFLEYCETNIPLFKYERTKDLMDLAAISIVSDVMNVSEMENRYYYYKGTELIKNLGIACLLDKIGVGCVNISSTELAFKLNKHLNSLLRLQDIRTIFRLILLYKGEENDNYIDKIIKAVETRDSIEDEIAASITILHDSKGVILAQNNYNGIDSVANNFNGVIASKMADKSSKNIIIVRNSLKGSARAFKGFDFKDYVNESKCAKGEGHQGAFGVTINDLDGFKSYILDHPPVFEIDSEYEIELSLKEMTKKLFEEVKEAQYLIGNGFSKIKFLVPNISIAEVKKTTGGNIYYQTEGTKSYIRFMDKTPQEEEIKKGNICNLYCTVDLKYYFGKPYYECDCYNIEIIDNSIDDGWGWED